MGEAGLLQLIRIRVGVVIGLLFLIGPFADLADERLGTLRTTAIVVGSALFIAVYLLQLPDSRVLARLGRAQVWGPLAALPVLALAVLALGAPWSFTTLFVYVVAPAGIRLRVPQAIAVIAVTAAGVGLGLWLSGANASKIATFEIVIVSIGAMMAAFGRKIVANRELHEAREELARLAVSEERLRIARDLHDLLGHSLSVIALKGELAGRLLERDPTRAAVELEDIQTVTRQALSEVREAVQGVPAPGAGGRARVRALRAANRGYRVRVRPAARRAARRCRGRARLGRARGRDQRRAPQRCGALLDQGSHRGRARPRRGRGQRALRGGPDRRREWPHGPRRARRGRTRHVRGGRPPRRRLPPAAHGPARALVIRVLIAEDQAMVRGALVSLLSLEGDIEVVAEVERGDEVLAAAQRALPDVALLDIEMPGQDGIAAAAELVRELPATRVLILTTFGRPGYLRRALEQGASGFLLKDAPARELAAAVRAVAAGLRAVDPALAAEAIAEGTSPLTAREAEVLAAAARHGTIAEIARALHLSEGTVRNYLSASMRKLGARNRREAVDLATRKGWL